MFTAHVLSLGMLTAVPSESLPRAVPEWVRFENQDGTNSDRVEGPMVKTIPDNWRPTRFGVGGAAANWRPVGDGWEDRKRVVVLVYHPWSKMETVPPPEQWVATPDEEGQWVVSRGYKEDDPRRHPMAFNVEAQQRKAGEWVTLYRTPRYYLSYSRKAK